MCLPLKSRARLTKSKNRRNILRDCSCFALRKKKRTHRETSSSWIASLARKGACWNDCAEHVPPCFRSSWSPHTPVNHSTPLHQVMYASLVWVTTAHRGDDPSMAREDVKAAKFRICLGWPAQKFQKPHCYFVWLDNGWKSTRHSSRE